MYFLYSGYLSRPLKSSSSVSTRSPFSLIFYFSSFSPIFYFSSFSLIFYCLLISMVIHSLEYSCETSDFGWSILHFENFS